MTSTIITMGPLAPPTTSLATLHDESDSTEEHESEEEDPHSPVLRRSVWERRLQKMYTPSNFSSNFSFSITDDDPRTIGEAMDSNDGNISKKAMDEEMASLDKNEA